MSLNIIKETSKFLICLCPRHPDNNIPNFYVNKCEHKGHPKGFGYCFACGFVKQYSSEFVDSMSKKKTKPFREQQPIDWVNLHQSLIEYPEATKHLSELAREWKINVWTLFKYEVGWTGNAYTIPMYIPKKGIVGIQLRYPDGSKSCIEGSQLGIFCPLISNNPPIIITEGFSDAAVATDLGYFGMGLPSAQIGHSFAQDWLVDNKVTSVTIVSYNDRAGQKSSLKMKKLCEQKGIDAHIVMAEDYKDLRDFYMSNGREKTVNFLKI
jgi:hypothetical protein